MPLPAPFLSPMKAVSGELPTGPGWAYELKWDGMRVMAATMGGRTELRGRSGSDVSAAFPELASLAEGIGSLSSKATLLDGEVAAFVDGKPSFQQLQHRMHTSRPSPQLLREVPVIYMVFDLLILEGQPVHQLDYKTRRKYLREVVPDRPCWKVPAHDEGDHKTLLQLAQQLGLEGLVAKRLDSPYRPGQRSRSWLKIKNTHRQEFAIGGWLEGEGELSGKIGSLLVGTWEDGRFVFAGSVGSGLTGTLRSQLEAAFEELSVCPFDAPPKLGKQAHWVQTRLSAEVRYLHWTQDQKLRHPSLLGVRTDKDPKSISREAPKPA